jgi:hypothetical protein
MEIAKNEATRICTVLLPKLCPIAHAPAKRNGLTFGEIYPKMEHEKNVEKK